MDKNQIELIRRIASVVGHEMRNPLAVIKNSAYFVKAKLGQSGLDPKIEKHLGIIESEISRADALIGDILAYSRPLELKPAPTALAALVEECLAAPAGVKIKKSLPANSPKISADAAVLKNALRRVLDNAFESINGQGAVTVSLSAAKGWALLEITDSGPGIKPESLALVFEPFYTTKPRGLGLGLSIARKAIEAHQGRLEVESSPKGGASFTILLPTAAK